MMNVLRVPGYDLYLPREPMCQMRGVGTERGPSWSLIPSFPKLSYPPWQLFFIFENIYLFIWLHWIL